MAFAIFLDGAPALGAELATRSDWSRLGPHQEATLGFDQQRQREGADAAAAFVGLELVELEARGPGHWAAKIEVQVPEVARDLAELQLRAAEAELEQTGALAQSDSGGEQQEQDGIQLGPVVAVVHAERLPGETSTTRAAGEARDGPGPAFGEVVSSATEEVRGGSAVLWAAHVGAARGNEHVRISCGPSRGPARARTAAPPAGCEAIRTSRATLERHSTHAGWICSRAIETRSQAPPPRPLSSHGVTAVVPAFNEVQAIRGVVQRLCALDVGAPLEVLVVDDGSTDGTAAELARLVGEEARLRVIRHDRNRGYGAALVTGILNASHEIVVMTDADGTYPEDRVRDLLARIDDGADMAVGARRGDEVHIPLVRRPAKAVLRRLASFLAGHPIPDLNSGLRALRRELVISYRAILPQGFSFTTTITLAALTNGHRVDYVDINYAQRGGSSKIRPVRDTLGFASLIVRTVLYFNPLKVFYPLAAIIGLGMLGSLGYDLFVEDPPNLGDKTVLLFVALVQVLAVGLLADLIDKKSRL